MNTFSTDKAPFLEKGSQKGAQGTVFTQGVEMTQHGASATAGAIGTGASAGYNTAASGANLAKDGAVAGYNSSANVVKAGYEAGAGYAMDAAKVTKMDEAVALMSGQFTNYMSMGFEQFGNIIPIDYYGPVEKLLINFFLFLPAFFSFYTIKMFHDSIYTMVVLSIFLFIGMTFLHYKMIDQKIWYFIALKNFHTDYKAKLNAAVAAGAGLAIGLAVVLILYFSFVPFGPKAINLQMPYWGNWWDVLYWAFFTLFFVGILPVAESVFYFVFQNNVWFSAGAKFKIAFAYSLYHFGWICEVIDNWWAILVLTILAFLVCVICLGASGRENIFKGITYRVGFGFAVWALLLYLYFYHGSKKLAIPTQFLKGSPNNIFMKK